MCTCGVKALCIPTVQVAGNAYNERAAVHAFPGIVLSCSMHWSLCEVVGCWHVVYAICSVHVFRFVAPAPWDMPASSTVGATEAVMHVSGAGSMPAQLLQIWEPGVDLCDAHTRLHCGLNGEVKTVAVEVVGGSHM